MNNDDFMQYASFFYLCVLWVANLRAIFEALLFCFLKSMVRRKKTENTMWCSLN